MGLVLVRSGVGMGIVVSVHKVVSRNGRLVCGWC